MRIWSILLIKSDLKWCIHLNRSLFLYYCEYGDLIQQYEVSLSRMLNNILTFDQQWLPNRSDFPSISLPWYQAWPSPNYGWFPWIICNECGMPTGNAYPSGNLVPSPFLGLAFAPTVETKFLELAMSLLDFSPWIPLGTFSILLRLLWHIVLHGILRSMRKTSGVWTHV